MPETSSEVVLGEISRLLAADPASSVNQKYRERIGRERISRDEDPASHLCVYFAAIDTQAKEVFLGRHRKAGLWLFSGGHLALGEDLFQAARREMGEEWGNDLGTPPLGGPELLTITPIEDPAKDCKIHFDIWFFLDVRQQDFNPEVAKLAEETLGMCWFNLEEARSVVSDRNTLLALDYIEQHHFSS